MVVLKGSFFVTRVVELTVNSIFAMCRVVVFSVKESNSNRCALLANRNMSKKEVVCQGSLLQLFAHHWHLPIEVSERMFLLIV